MKNAPLHRFAALAFFLVGGLIIASPIAAQVRGLGFTEGLDSRRGEIAALPILFSPHATEVLTGSGLAWWEYPLWGVPIGGALGLATFYIEDAVRSCEDDALFTCREGMAFYTVGGATIGGVIGGAIGLGVLIWD